MCRVLSFIVIVFVKMRSKKRRELLKIENLTLKIQVFWLRRLKIASSAGSPILLYTLREKGRAYCAPKAISANTSISLSSQLCFELPDAGCE